MDFDLHGIVGIRCLGATAGDLAAVSRQLGSLRGELQREPDITLRFVDRIEPRSPLRLLSVDDVAYSDDAFFVLRGRHESHVMVQIPFEDVGGRCELVCERGLVEVPLLIAIVNATALSRSWLPLHASAFVKDGVGALVTGWSRGGKTGILLGFMARGARYVGDQWVYLEEGGTRMCGIPEPIRLRQWHLEQLPDYQARLPWRRRVVLRALSAVTGTLERLASRSRRTGSIPRRQLARLLPLLRRQLRAECEPQALFGRQALALEAAPDRIFLVGSREVAGVSVAPIESREVAERVLFSLGYEREALMSCYRKFRFAFPERANPLLDRSDEIERSLLAKALEGRPAYRVDHPTPVVISELVGAIEPLL